MNKLGVVLGAFLLTFNCAWAKGKLLKTPRTDIPTYKEVKIDPDRLVVLKGPIDAAAAKRTVKSITDLDLANKNPIYFVINSPGGSVISGFEIVEAVESAKSPIVCIYETEVFSMAALIGVYCPTAYTHKFAMMMFHEASYQVQGTESEIMAQVLVSQKSLNQLHKDVARHLGLTLKQYKAKIHGEWWLTAEDMVKVGLADGIITTLQYKYEEPPQELNLDLLFKTILPAPGLIPGLHDVDLIRLKFHAGDKVKVIYGFFAGCAGGTVRDYDYVGDQSPIYFVANMTCGEINRDAWIEEKFLACEGKCGS